MKNVIRLISLLFFSLTLVNCQRDLSSNFYSNAEIGEAAEVKYGEIVAAREVKVRDKSQLSGYSGGVGTLAGAVGGGLVGSNIGKGRGQVAGTAGGAIAGAMIGSLVEDKLSEQVAMEYVVQLEDKTRTVIVQGKNDGVFAVGTRVMVMYYNKASGGRARLRPVA